MFWTKRQNPARVLWDIDGADCYECTRDEMPASVFVGIDLARLAPVKGQRYLHGVTVAVKRPNVFGYPNPDEATTLSRIEENLVPILEKASRALYVGNVTTNGQRRFYFYARHGKVAQQDIDHVFHSFPIHKYACSVADDPEWNFYFDDLYPTELAYHSIVTRRVLEGNVGVHGTNDRAPAITHFLYLSDARLRNECLNRLRLRGCEVLPEPEQLADAGIHRLRVVQHDALSHAAICALMVRLICALQAYPLAYSHWEVAGEFSYTSVANEVKLRIAAEVQAGVRDETALQQFGIHLGKTISGDEAKRLLLDELK